MTPEQLAIVIICTVFACAVLSILAVLGLDLLEDKKEEKHGETKHSNEKSKK